MSRIEINHLDFTYEGSFDPVFEDVTLQLDTNWRLGLIGRNGRGKTTLLRLLMGDLPHEGAIRTTMSFDYFPFPVRQPQNSTEVILAEICGQPSWMIRCECARLDLREDTLARPFVQISPGEQTKALLAALFLIEMCIRDRYSRSPSRISLSGFSSWQISTMRSAQKPLPCRSLTNNNFIVFTSIRDVYKRQRWPRACWPWPRKRAF